LLGVSCRACRACRVVSCVCVTKMCVACSAEQLSRGGQGRRRRISTACSTPPGNRSTNTTSTFLSSRCRRAFPVLTRPFHHTRHTTRTRHDRRSYGEVLYRWGLLEKRAEVLKLLQTSTKQQSRMCIGLSLACHNCGQPVTGPSPLCTACHMAAFRCALCHTPVRGTCACRVVGRVVGARAVRRGVC
jgi:hypothetical protein